MSKKQNKSDNASKDSAAKKREKNVLRLKLGSFLTVSIYDLVTWVGMGLCIGLVLIYGFQKNWRGFVWSLIALGVLILVMLAIRAKQHFWDDAEGGTRTARPELYAHGAMMPSLVPGQPETVLVGLGNRGNATARNICLGGGNHIFTKSDFAGPLVYKHTAVRVRTDIGPGDKEENSLVSASTLPLSRGQIEQLKSGEVLFFHFAEGEYSDDDGNAYPIDFCYMFNPRSPNVMGVCPEKYWPKSRTERRGVPTLDLVQSSPSPEDRFRWTDYREDYFLDAIWQWDYIPAMGDIPRNIRGFCPECRNTLMDTSGRGRSADGTHYARLLCPNHPLKTYHIASDSDSYDGIKRRVQEKLRSGRWREVVKRQVISPKSGLPGE